LVSQVQQSKQREEDDEESQIFDKLIDYGISVLKVLVTNPAGIGLVAIGIGVYMKSLPRTKTVTQDLGMQKRYRLNIEGVRLIYNIIVKASGDEYGISTDPKYGQHQFRIGRNLAAENQRCTDLLAAGDIEFDSTCELYGVGPTTITKEVPTGYDPVIDLFPFDLWGLVPPETGQMHLSDALILGGLLAIGGQALAGIVK